MHRTLLRHSLFGSHGRGFWIAGRVLPHVVQRSPRKQHWSPYWGSAPEFVAVLVRGLGSKRIAVFVTFRHDSLLKIVLSARDVAGLVARQAFPSGPRPALAVGIMEK